MKKFLSEVAVAASVMLLLGCMPSGDSSLLKDGIGTSLPSADIKKATKLQEIYAGQVCIQAGVPVSREVESPYCIYDSMGSDEWGLFVQAGMDDIDRRCDAYLAWLDRLRRSQKPVRDQIDATRATVSDIVKIASESATSLQIVGIAFDLLTRTNNNLYSRLLLSIEASTVNAVVYGRQRDFRIDVREITIDNKPAAFHVLRSYLRICLPFTIETEINNVLVLRERGQDFATDLIEPAMTVGRPLRARDPLPPTPPVPDTIQGAVTSAEKAVSEPDLVVVQEALCLRGDGVVGPETRDAIRIYEATVSDPSPDGLLSQSEIQKLLRFGRERGACDRNKFRNYLERQLFDRDGGPSLVNRFQAKLNEVEPANGVPETGQLDAGTRKKIQSVRQLKQLPRENAAQNEQITPEFLLAIGFP